MIGGGNDNQSFNNKQLHTVKCSTGVEINNTNK